MRNSHHCEPTGRGNARPITGSAKHSWKPKRSTGIFGQARDEQKRAPLCVRSRDKYVDWPMICSLTAHTLADPAPRLAMTGCSASAARALGPVPRSITAQ
jgi:hypothetical protein